MQRFISFGLTLLFVCALQTNSMAQLGSSLKSKLKNAAKSALEEDLLGGKEEPVEDPAIDNSAPDATPNTSVKGKKLKPPAVDDHLKSATSALNGEQYTTARFDVKEAMRGVELEIGYNLLDIMPKKVDGIDFVEESDGVTSSGIGFAGLVVTRRYENDEKQITASIGNNSAFGASYDYLINSSYASTDEDRKNVTVQGYRGSLAFDGGSTYSLGVPFGQNSVYVLECYGCEDEDAIMTAAGEFSISAFDELLKDTGSDTGVDEGVDQYISSASSSYASEDLESTRFSLQKALEALDILIGKKILEMLPTELAGLSASPDADEHVASAAGFAGVYIERYYTSETDTTKQIEITLMDDSPYITMVNAFVNTPMMMGMSGKKSIKIDGFKGMYEPVEGSEPKEISISIPSNQSLLTMRFIGLTDSEVNATANKVPVGEIFKLLK